MPQNETDRLSKLGGLIARFDARAFRFIGGFCSDEETRYYLRGVRIEPLDSGGVAMIATDGRRMGVYHDAEGWARRPLTVLWPCNARFTGFVEDAEDQAIHVLEGFGHDARLFAAGDGAGKWITECAIGVEIEGPSRDFRYPDWRAVVPWGVLEQAHPTRATLDFGLARKFAAAWHTTEMDPDTGATIPIEDRRAQITMLQAAPGEVTDQPVIVLREDIPGFLGVLMPVTTPRDLKGTSASAKKALAELARHLGARDGEKGSAA